MSLCVPPDTKDHPSACQSWIVSHPAWVVYPLKQLMPVSWRRLVMTIPVASMPRASSAVFAWPRSTVFGTGAHAFVVVHCIRPNITDTNPGAGSAAATPGRRATDSSAARSTARAGGTALRTCRPYLPSPRRATAVRLHHVDPVLGRSDGLAVGRARERRAEHRVAPNGPPERSEEH